MNYRIVTMGCKVNQHESQQMSELLRQNGFSLADDNGTADIVIINSCTVTATADQKTRQILHRERRNNPDAVICLTGCMPQAFPNRAEELSEADIYIGNANRSRIIEYINAYLENHHQVTEIVAHSKDFESLATITHLDRRTRGYIKIEDGCDRFCAYCIIPYARGRVRSRSIESIKEEAKALSQNCREVVLVGINLSAYGKELGLTLADAVDAVAEIDGIDRIRLGSMEPDMLDDVLIERLAGQSKLCPQFHISLQSGCDATLKRMNRHYTSDDYRCLVRKLRESFDHPSITTDVMVGFAGETHEEFEQSYAFVKEIGFARTHCFVYSRREGTVAYNMPNQVEPAAAAGRSARMIALSNKSEQEFLSSMIGRRVTVLVERPAGDDEWEGYSENYVPVRVHTPCTGGELVTAEIFGVSDGCCSADRVDD